MKDRGLYFDRTNDLAILGTSGSNLKLNPSFSLFFWSRFLDDFAYILGRYDEVYNKLFTMDISMGFIKVEVTIDGQETELQSFTSTLNDGNWYNIGLVCYFNTPTTADMT